MISGAVPFFTLPDVITTKDGQAEDSSGSTHTYTGATTTGPITFVAYTNENRTNPRRDVTAMRFGGNLMQEVVSQGVGGSLDGFCKIFVIRGAFSNADIVAEMDGGTDNSAITYGSLQNTYDLLPIDTSTASGSSSAVTYANMPATRARQTRLLVLAFGNSGTSLSINPGVELSDFNGGDHRHFAGYSQTANPSEDINLTVADNPDTLTTAGAVFN
jgi:hypothetical protein